MKKSTFTLSSILVFFLLLMTGRTAYALAVQGHITDNITGLPVPGHPVFVMVDEAGGQGFNHFNKLVTDNNGYYSDTFFIPQGIPLTLLILTFDCNMVPFKETINVASQQYTKDFQLCGGLSGCHAWFSTHTFHPNPLRISFRNFSVGNFNTWQWDFGDGNTSAQFNPVYQYSSPGVYTVSLTVSHSNPNFNCFNTYIDTIVVGPQMPCQAGFTAWANVSNPMKWHFQQQSSGNINHWIWDFGDGITAIGQNTMHIYSDTGLYQVCHIIQGPQCQDTSCQWIHVSSPGYYNLAGQVFAGFFPAQEADVMLFQKVNGKYMLDRVAPVDSMGVYYFYQILGGQYLLRSSIRPGSGQYGNYIPTYHPSSHFWGNASEINLNANNYNANIQLKPFPVLPSGNGQISGLVLYHDSTGSKNPAKDIEILLLNPAGHPVGATWSAADGSFVFSGIKLGQYQIHAEVTGIPTQAAQATLTPSKPVVDDITLEVQPMMVLVVHPPKSKVAVSLHVFPNPFRESISLEVESLVPTEVHLILTDINGTQWFENTLTHHGGRIAYPVGLSKIPAGVYIMRVLFQDGQSESLKIIKIP